jgi:hypothetical protein
MTKKSTGSPQPCQDHRLAPRGPFAMCYFCYFIIPCISKFEIYIYIHFNHKYIKHITKTTSLLEKGLAVIMVLGTHTYFGAPLLVAPKSGAPMIAKYQWRTKVSGAPQLIFGLIYR